MGRRRLPYGDGDWCAIPLRTDEPLFALGLIARHDGRGIALGYFFGDKYHEPPSLHEISLQPDDAVLISMFGDLGLINEDRWKVLGRKDDRSTEGWPMPTFCRGNVNGRAYEVTYDITDLSVTSEVPISPERCQSLPTDSLAGAGSIEMKLTKLIVGRTEPSPSSPT